MYAENSKKSADEQSTHYPGQKKLRQPRMPNDRRVHAQESTRLYTHMTARLSQFFFGQDSTIFQQNARIYALQYIYLMIYKMIVTETQMHAKLALRQYVSKNQTFWLIKWKNLDF